MLCQLALQKMQTQGLNPQAKERKPKPPHNHSRDRRTTEAAQPSLNRRESPSPDLGERQLDFRDPLLILAFAGGAAIGYCTLQAVRKVF